MRLMKILAVPAALVLCMTGCGESSGASVESSTDTLNTTGELRVICEGETDPAYGETLKKYFTAIEKNDFEAYKETVYPPYLTAYEAYLGEQGKTLADTFPGLHARFDEDGYESWTLTELYVNIYEPQQTYREGMETAPPVDYADEFLEAFVDSGVITEDDAEQTRKDAKDMQDIQFSLYALYAGDEEDVQIIKGSEILMLKTADGCFLFG